MGDLLLVDTDILIDGARARPEAISFLQAYERTHTLSLSVVTKMEMLVGCRNKSEQTLLDRSLECFTIISIQESMSLEAAQLLRSYFLSHGLLIPDAFIAATSLVLGIPLATKNRRDYQFIKGLELIPYPLRIAHGGNS